jgi:PadR family transcriptional regulator, regulatory protein AphA
MLQPMASATRPTTRLSTTEYAVLGMLSWGEQSGYELKKIAEAGVGYLWTAAKSHVYAVLPSLVRGGYATSRRVTQASRPDKQLYRITRRGRAAFRDWLEEPAEGRGERSTFLLKLFFGDQMSKEALVAHIERRRQDAAAELAEYREIEKRIKGVEANYFGYVTLRWGLAQSRAWIRWADEILRELEGR